MNSIIPRGQLAWLSPNLLNFTIQFVGSRSQCYLIFSTETPLLSGTLILEFGATVSDDQLIFLAWLCNKI